MLQRVSQRLCLIEMRRLRRREKFLNCTRSHRDQKESFESFTGSFSLLIFHYTIWIDGFGSNQHAGLEALTANLKHECFKHIWLTVLKMQGTGHKAAQGKSIMQGAFNCNGKFISKYPGQLKNYYPFLSSVNIH